MKRPDYAHSIVNVSASIMRYYGLPAAHAPLAALEPFLSRKWAHVSLMLFDALGVEMLTRHLREDDFLRKHMRTSVTSVFPSTTVAATTAILTGKTPLETGLLGWFQYVPEHDLYYTVFKNEDFYAPEKPVPADLAARFKQTVFLSAIDARDDVDAKIIYPVPVEKDGYVALDEGLARLERFQREHTRTFSYFYSTEPDITAHEKGVYSPETAAAVKNINAQVERYAQNRPKNTLLIIVADHGMVDVEPVSLLDDGMLCALLAKRPAIEPRATSFHVKPGAHDAFANHFKARYGKDFDLYTKDALLKSGLLGSGKRHPLIDETLGDFMSVAKGRAYFSLSRDMIFKGHHAGLTPEEMNVPLIVVEGDDGYEYLPRIK